MASKIGKIRNNKMIDRLLRKLFKHSLLYSSGFLIMFIPKCSFLKNKLDEDVVHVYRRVIVEDVPSYEELDIIEDINLDEDLSLLD